MENNKSYAGKWIKLGVSGLDREKIYQRLRGRAKHLLFRRHKEEYKRILTKLLKAEFERLEKLTE